jgi:hypothetical protein
MFIVNDGIVMEIMWEQPPVDNDIIRRILIIMRQVNMPRYIARHQLVSMCIAISIINESNIVSILNKIDIYLAGYRDHSNECSSLNNFFSYQSRRSNSRERNNNRHRKVRHRLKYTSDITSSIGHVWKIMPLDKSENQNVRIGLFQWNNRTHTIDHVISMSGLDDWFLRVSFS